MRDLIKSKRRWLFAAAGLLVAVTLKLVINMPQGQLSYSNSFLSLLVWAAYAFTTEKLFDSEHWKRRTRPFMAAGVLFAFLFVGSLLIGVQLERSGCLEWENRKIAAALVILSLAIAPYITVMMEKLAGGGIASTGKRTEHKSFLRIWGTLILVYTVALLACWPGNFGYDAELEYEMVASGAYLQHHPLAHVLLLGGIIQMVYKITGSYNWGIAVYTVFQILVVSACLAYMLYTLAGFGIRRWVWGLSFAILALFPTVQVFVVCSTKDVLFSAGVILFMTLLLEMARAPEEFWKQKHRTVLFICASFLIVLMRNNGVYAYAVFMVLFAVVYRRQWRRWLAALLAVAAVYIGVNTGLAAALSAKPGSVKEMLCVPLQQMARVYNMARETYTESELAQLASYVEENRLALYVPKNVDWVKAIFSDETFHADPWAFWRLWATVGLRRPDMYLDSFLINTYQYWYMDTYPDGYIGFVEPYIDKETCYFYNVTESPGERASLIPALDAFYSKISWTLWAQRIPGIGPLFAMSLWHWIWVFAVLYLGARREWRMVCTLLLPVLVYATVLLGPIALVRYVLYLLFGLPIVLAYIFDADALKGAAV